MSRLRKTWIVPALLLAPLAACGDNEPEQPETTSQVRTEGETMEIDNQVRIQIPDGWEVQPGDIPGLGIYVFAIVPEGTAPDALVPGGEPADFPYLTLLNIGRTNGAEGYAPAQLEADKENSDLYSDIKDLDSITIGDSSFYGYEGNLTTSHHDGPFQYWYGDANSDTYKFEIFGERQGDIPRELIDAMKSAEFIR